MVSIYAEDRDRTGQFKDWTIFIDKGVLKLQLRFPSEKTYTWRLDACRVVPTRTVPAGLCKAPGGSGFRAIDGAVIYGERYAVLDHGAGQTPSVVAVEGLEFAPAATFKDEEVFRYLVDVAEARVALAGTNKDKKRIAENIQSQLEKALPHEDTALRAYCTARNEARQAPNALIYPYGVNESQLQAVERAFASQVSIIEGPPGTGKTQTILNIVANILSQGKTVAILSNNNAAVENVYEKLGKSGLGHLVGRLGKKDNKENFFAELPVIPSEVPAPAPTMEHLQAVLGELKDLLGAQNEAARLRAEIDELNIERRYLLEWQRDNLSIAALPLDKYGLTGKQTTELMAYLAYLAEGRVGILERIELLFNFRIFRIAPFADGEKRKAAIHALQLHFYDRELRKKTSELAQREHRLKSGRFEPLLNELTAGSMAWIKRHLHETLSTKNDFTLEGYRVDSDAFVKRFPIIGSSTHSILNSLGKGALIDYVIIDEASQQDIVPGVLAMACARNLIVVGDRKQLPHIPADLRMAPPADIYDCDRYSLLDSCLGVFGASIPVTLLKEHYRCHPRIIQFCNQQFYDNALVPMTRDDGKASMNLIVTAKGNHARGFTNLREMDSVLRMLEWDGQMEWDEEKARGFIAPYNAQVDLSRKHLPGDFVNDTVHKFQGRECDEIVFSSVLDKKQANVRNLAFVDNPNLINVAVSRAKHRFTLVTGDEVFAGNHGHIAALVRYIEYYADEKQILRAPVVSAFDLLYREYDQSLERLNRRLRASDSRFKSEQIVAQLLREALRLPVRSTMTFHSQVALGQVASSNNDALSHREREFMAQGASCDFVVYFKVGKTPLGVIEVDGGSHDTARQAERDALKDSILAKSGIALLRLRTVESRIEEKIGTFLDQWTMAEQGAVRD